MTDVTPRADTAFRVTPSMRMCPHCRGGLAIGDPAQPVRCMTCRLVVGPGRSVALEEAGPGGRSAGAGVLAAQARRQRDDTVADPARVVRDLVAVAGRLDVSPDALRMVDYQAAWLADPRLASLAAILGTFDTWKAARAAAARAGGVVRG